MKISLIKIITDIRQPITSIAELENRLKILRNALKRLPQEGTEEFRKLAREISSKLNISIEQSEERIKDWGETATREVQNASNAVKEYRRNLRTIAPPNTLAGLREQLRRAEIAFSRLNLAAKDFSKRQEELRLLRQRIFDIERATGDARRGVGQYERALRGLNSSLREFASLVGVGFGISEIGQNLREGINIFADFKQQIAILGAVSNSTTEDLAELEKQSISLGSSTQFTALQYAELQTELARLGFSTQEILDTTKAAGDVAISTGEDIAKSAKVIGQSIRAYGLETEEAARVADVLTKSFNTSGLQLETFSEASKLLAPIARVLKVPIEEATAAIGIFADNGLEGTIATQTLGTSFLNLADESRKYAKEAEKIGVEVFNQKGEFVGLANLLRDLEEATKDYSDQERLATLGRIVGARSARNFSILLEGQKKVIEDGVEVTLQGADALEAYTKQLEEAGGTAEATAKRVGDTLAQDFLRFKSAVEGATIALLNAYNEGLRQFVQEATRLVPILIRNIDLVAQLAIGIALMVKNGLAIRVLSTAYGILSGQIALATIRQQAFNLVARANPYGILISLVTSAYLAYQVYARSVKTAKEEQEELNKAIAEANIQIEKEEENLNKLIEPLRDATKSEEERGKAIKELVKTYPDFIRAIDLEKASTEELNVVQARLLRLRRRQIAEQQKQALITPILEEQVRLESRLADIRARGFEALEGTTLFGIGFSGEKGNVDITGLTRLVQGLDETGEEFAIRTAQERIQNEIQRGNDRILDIENQFSSQLIKTRADLYDELAVQDIRLEREANEAEAKRRAERLRNLRGTGRRPSENEEEQKELEAAEGSLKRLRDEVSRLRQEIEVAPPSIILLDSLTKQLNDAEKALEDAENLLDLLKNPINEIKIRIETELTSNIQSLEQEREVILRNETLTQEQRQLINEEFNLKRENLELAAQERILNARRELEVLNDEQRLELDRSYYEVRRSLAQNQVQFEENQRKQALASDKALIEERRRILEESARSEISELESLRQKAISDESLTQEQRENLLLQYANRREAVEKNLEIELLRFRISLLKEGSEERLKLEQELADKEFEVRKSLYDKDLKEKQRIEKEKEEIQKAVLNAGFQVARTIVNTTFEVSKNRAEQRKEEELKILDDQLQEQLDRVKGNSEAEQAINEEFERRKQRLEDQANERSKRAAITTAGINTALAVTNALATVQPFYAAIIAAALAAAAGAAQIAVIRSSKYQKGVDRFKPKKAKGGYLDKGVRHSYQDGMPILDPISQRIVAYIEKDEAIVTRAAMLSKKEINVQGTPLDIISYINSQIGGGVSYPGAKTVKVGGHDTVYTRTPNPLNKKYAMGTHRFGVSHRVRKLQNGATIASIQNSVPSVIDNTKIDELIELQKITINRADENSKMINETIQSQESTLEQLQKVAEILNDREIASS